MNQEITDKIITKKPHIEAKLKIASKHTLIFTSDENLEPYTKYTVVDEFGNEAKQNF